MCMYMNMQHYMQCTLRMYNYTSSARQCSVFTKFLVCTFDNSALKAVWSYFPGLTTSTQKSMHYNFMEHLS